MKGIGGLVLFAGVFWWIAIDHGARQYIIRQGSEVATRLAGVLGVQFGTPPANLPVTPQTVSTAEDKSKAQPNVKVRGRPHRKPHELN